MNWRFITLPSGVCSAYATQKKEMPLPLAVPLVMAGASLASSLFGAKKSSDAAKDAAAKLQAEKVATENERRRRRNESWTDTKSGQNMLRVLQQQADREMKRIQGAAAVGGATDAAVAKEKELLNDKQAEVLADAEARFEDKKDAVDAQYRQELKGLNQQQIATDLQKGQAVAQAAGGVSSALATGAAMTFGGTKAGQEMLGPSGGSPAAGGTTPAPAPKTSLLDQMGYGKSLFQSNKRYGLMQKSNLYNPQLFWNL